MKDVLVVKNGWLVHDDDDDDDDDDPTKQLATLIVSSTARFSIVEVGRGCWSDTFPRNQRNIPGTPKNAPWKYQSYIIYVQVRIVYILYVLPGIMKGQGIDDN